MAKCQDVIQSAYRRSTVIGAGVTPNNTQFGIGLELLQGLYMKFIGDGLFGRMTDSYVGPGNLTIVAAERQRIFNGSGGNLTVSLPTVVQGVDPFNYDYGFVPQPPQLTEFPGPRQPFDNMPITIINPIPTAPSSDTYLYDANQGMWVKITNLGLEDYAPLSGRYEDGIKCMLAVIIADEQPMQAPPMVMSRAKSFRLSLASGYDSPRRPAVGSDF